MKEEELKREMKEWIDELVFYTEDTSLYYVKEVFDEFIVTIELDVLEEEESEDEVTSASREASSSVRVKLSDD